MQPGEMVSRLHHNIASVLLGQPDAIELALVALFADGHLLIEDVPGIGKTLLARALAKSIDCAFHRIQFTPDLLPSDLIGISVFHQPSGEFVFKPGPLFASIILADEINRATPRTQSALLEAMSDRQVSVDGETRTLASPFMVIATQNPYEFEGTFPLPENQLDRFLMRLRIGYPDRQTEKEILNQHRNGEPIDRLEAVVCADDLKALQSRVKTIHVDERINEYVLDLVEATRRHEGLYLGVSTRGALALFRAAQALALIRGRDYVIPDDVKRLAKPVLSHRLLPRQGRRGGQGNLAELIVDQILEQTTVPI
ncbi:MAG: magnesium chelatase [Gemmatales bacterium]|nr:MAG: magnesium chelatase [Gemmatales bacterium]